MPMLCQTRVDDYRDQIARALDQYRLAEQFALQLAADRIASWLQTVQSPAAESDWRADWNQLCDELHAHGITVVSPTNEELARSAQSLLVRPSS